MKALVLSGGSILGAFQAGAIEKLLRDGFVPDLVVGISVGALNGAFITNFIGEWRNAKKPKVNAQTGETMWQTAGKELVNFWSKNARKPEDLIIPNANLTVSLLFGGQFNGIYNPAPLYALIDRTISVINLRHEATCQLYMGAVRVGNGEIEYVNQESDNVIAFIKASPAIPVVLPMVEIDGNFYTDGGVRDIVPLQKAIELGATEIKVIICQSTHLETKNVNTNTLASFVGRAIDILTNEVAVNDLVVDAKDRAKVKSVELIQPPKVLTTIIDNFQSANILEMLEMGSKAAETPKDLM
jgi:NTE family protein